MALRAGYFGLKRFEKNKVSILAASTPADISPDNPLAGKDDVLASIDLLDDTVGWIGGNVLPNKGTSQVSHGITWTVNADKTVTATGTKADNAEGLKILDRSTDNYSLPTGKYIFSGNPSNDTYMLIQATRSGQLVQLASLETADAVAEANILSTDVLQCVLFVRANKTVNNVVFKPMLLTEEQYNLNQAYRSNHESVAEMIGNNGTYDVCLIVSAVTPSNGAQPEFFIPWFNPEFKTPTFSLTIRLRGESAWQTLEQSGAINVQKVCKNGFLVNPELTTALTANTSYTFRIDGTITFGASNREITAEPEVKEPTKKATKKKVIKEEE